MAYSPASSLWGIGRWCPGELPDTPIHPHQLIAVEGDLFPMLAPTALPQDLSLLKSITAKKRSLLSGSELGHSCWSLPTTECFATEFPGGENGAFATEVTNWGHPAPGAAWGSPWSHLGSVATCPGLLSDPQLPAGLPCCSRGPNRRFLIELGWLQQCLQRKEGRSKTRSGITCPGGRCFLTSYLQGDLLPVPSECS